MKHQIKGRYPVPAAAVLKAFADEAFHKRKLEQLGFKYRVLEAGAQGKDYRIVIERKVPMDAPGMIKKFFPVESTVVNEESWNATTKTGKVKVQPSGVPVEMSCTAALTDEAGGKCVITYEWEIKAKVPLVGGAIEKFVAGDMDKRMAEETRVGAELTKSYAAKT